MKKVKLAGLIAAFVPFMASAHPCDGYEIKLRNNLIDDLLITTVKLQGGKLNPSGMQKLDSQTEQVLTVNKTSAAGVMKGEIVFHTISLPSRTITIRFNLVNDHQTCKHTDTSPPSDYIITRTSQSDKINYSINYK
ncbi:hypothetical protein [Legionella gresilensis]|uniref:hypothetical protein n=1 Tax=Legionella gresilensis TaxID=91823 RepID=UPI0010418073|nr:hypothetical protein [Legionella gresilensis]